jgi:hypothetical protein
MFLVGQTYSQIPPLMTKTYGCTSFQACDFSDGPKLIRAGQSGFSSAVLSGSFSEGRSIAYCCALTLFQIVSELIELLSPWPNGRNDASDMFFRGLILSHRV